MDDVVRPLVAGNRLAADKAAELNSGVDGRMLPSPHKQKPPAFADG